MQKWLANIHVTLKPVVNDPPGLAIRDALHNLGFDGVMTVRSGKYIQVYLNANGEEDARAATDSMCRRLLANPVIEDYTFNLETIE
ncbi:MAG TPA: phosphoribosylformylglycinamidine synthase subunit PurS [Chloroflexia bacterium]|jgi:phosphoribosylformylglycinamidine synthase